MKYKAYTGVVELDEESGVLFGRVIGLRDVITFQGESVAEVTKAFHGSVDCYLDFCAKRGESPEKPYSGQFVLRVTPELHRELAHTALARATSLNALIEETLKTEFLQREQERSREAASSARVVSTAKKLPTSKKKVATKKTPLASK